MAARFTERELDVMRVLWDNGPSTVAEVRDRLRDPLAYTTVLTILRVLEEKGHVVHHEEGRAHRYAARVKETRARKTALSRMVDRLFKGSPALLLSQLVSDRRMSKEDLEELRRMVDERLAEKKR